MTTGTIKWATERIETATRAYRPGRVRFPDGSAISTTVTTVHAAVLQTGWSNYGGGFVPLSYYKDLSGIVHLVGLVNRTGGSSLVFTLPAGFRPSSNHFTYIRSFSGVFGEFEVSTAGLVSLNIPAGTGAGLMGLSFVSGN